MTVTAQLVAMVNTYRLKNGGDPALLVMGRVAYDRLVGENPEQLREKTKPNHAPSFAGIDIEVLRP